MHRRIAFKQSNRMRAMQQADRLLFAREQTVQSVVSDPKMLGGQLAVRKRIVALVEPERKQSGAGDAHKSESRNHKSESGYLLGCGARLLQGRGHPAALRQLQRQSGHKNIHTRKQGRRVVLYIAHIVPTQCKHFCYPLQCDQNQKRKQIV